VNPALMNVRGGAGYRVGEGMAVGVEGAYGIKLYIKDHLKLEEIPKGPVESKIEKELQKFQTAKKQISQKIESIKSEQANQGLPALIQRDDFDIPFSTGDDGFLSGRGVLSAGDQLVALWPVPTDTLRLTPPQPMTAAGLDNGADADEFTTNYSLFYTSAAPNETGLAMDEVTADRLTQPAMAPRA